MELIKASLMAAAMQGGGGGNLGSLSVTENGTYTPQSTGQSVDGWNSVAVSVPITPLTVNANGTYTAASGGYSPVTVDVPTYEQEYQEALEQLQEMQQCCADVADMLGAEAGCNTIKQAVIELIAEAKPSADDINNYDVTTATENETKTYMYITGDYYYKISTSWGSWTYHSPSIVSAQHYTNKESIVIEKYALSGQLINTITRTVDVTVNSRTELTPTRCFQALGTELWSGQNPAYTATFQGTTMVHAFRGESPNGYYVASVVSIDMNSI